MSIIKRGFIYALSDIHFHTLSNFSSDIEHSIKTSSAEYIAHLEAISENYKDDNLEMFWEYNIDQVNDLRYEYPTLLRSSVLISCYSNLEKTMVNFHEDLKLKTGLSLNYNNRRFSRRSTIEKVLESLQESIPLPNSSGSIEWTNILFYKSLRNKVVHDLGKINKRKDRALLNQIEQSSFVSVNEINTITFNEHFSEKVITDCRNFIDLLYTDIKLYTDSLRPSS
ncbi:hypothetical protein PC41400_14925 [Paenibacillus chitinolyticus]|uniref:RiboL-PSP-HEPN domain-containing protein n=1 Tax=Paenibacillus chitinolyticus TaxID=79263 RepID=A0A410WX40_9BACL|nr:hypothetical protein [Paenibacillus chitinolyticus]MCY9592362.1 hypothetical protein [Paenibacillus chitinolyticus]MCY9599823.1 hypothetical protein [Paenibacillus chitinolyticus]QAV18900.1 hypothetical protein PC41400_14925 [Paenibacillus chitinolyticus]